MRAVLSGWGLPILLLALHGAVLLAQEQPKEKKNPVMRNTVTPLQEDTAKAPAAPSQRPLPKFDLPEYVITGTASIDLPKLEKMMVDDSPVVQRTMVNPSEKKLRDRETLELEMNNRWGNSHVQANRYSGFARAGIGTYFTPQAELQFGQTSPEYFYSLGGKYFLTKGYARGTDESSGALAASGGTTLTLSRMPLLQDAALKGTAGYRSESYHFYGSATPDLPRTISDFSLQAGLENQMPNSFPYSALISFERMDVSDSSASAAETRFDLKGQTSFPIASLPIRTSLHFMSASGGIAFMDISAEAGHYWHNDFLLEGSLHVSWVQGMAGQDLVRFSPQILASYQVASQHRLYVSVEQKFVPMTLTSHFFTNRYLSAASSIRHENITGAGELGVESNWTEAVRSRVSINVKSARDLPMFSDSSRHGVWMLAYGGKTTIVTFCAEMVAKLNSNDYFASNILLRSTKDSFFGGSIPYTPAIEAWCSAIHRFGTSLAVRADVRFAGGRTSDLAGEAALPDYAVVDMGGEYTPCDFLRLAVGVKNVTDAQFETWRGYREFPLTLHVDAQIRW